MSNQEAVANTMLVAMTVPVTREECTHVFYVFAIRYHAERAEMSRRTFVKAMQAEGISVGAGYLRPLYFEHLYQRRIVYGRGGCPFTCSSNSEVEVSYETGLCPIAERMYFEELITTEICKYPNTEETVEEFVRAVEKIYTHREKLREFISAGAVG